ncbi:MAG: TraB/GumN family protein [Parvularcula sp.]|jgi:uncharacterized protein YbaP (TraB family)|nr:TraB/GumN family protein [Parvularcula sp.]
MWVVTDQDSRIVLVPTIHYLPENIEWYGPRLRAAVTEADRIWFEVPLSELRDASRSGALIAELGLLQDGTLTGRLSPEKVRELRRVARRLGLPMKDLEAMRPWLAAITISVTDLMNEGFDPDYGVEKALSARAGELPERGLETMQQQLRFFADLPLEAELAFLDMALASAGKGPAAFRALAASWARGDVSGLEAGVLDGLRGAHPELHRVLVTTRNRAWAELLTELMAGDGHDLVAVGAGHLVGDDGLPALLAARGFTVEEIGFAPSP